MSLRSKMRAGPGALVLMLRALRLLAISNHALRRGRPAEDILRALARSNRPVARTSPAAATTAVRRAGLFVPGATCVPQAIALAALLTPAQVPVAVVLGAQRHVGGGRWAAHAWVEVAGVPWPHHGAGAFQRLATYTTDFNWSLTPLDDPAPS